jgi:hypothetical protein
MTDNSLRDMPKISSELIQERITTVKMLSQLDSELYEVVKDKQTGEHYLHYAYLHRNFTLTGTGESETFHHLLPLNSDDVVGVIFGEQTYTYPQAWMQSFLRNGPEGYYVWFDPSYESEHALNEEIGQEIANKLKQFKQSGTFDEQSVKRLLDDLNRDYPKS